MPLINARNSEKGLVSFRRQSEAGQILLIVVLASVISLTVGLAAISRSVTNTRISTEEANSQKALAAAEAGVEEQLNRANLGNSQAISSELSNNSTFDATVDSVSGTALPINNNLPISQDEGADIWLSDYPNFTNPINTTLTILWGNPGTDACTVPALEVAVIYGNRNDPSMSRYTADPCTSRRASNRFNGNGIGGSSSITFDGTNYQYAFSYTLPAISSGYIARVIPLYANAGRMGVRSSVALPDQGFVIDSTGTAGNAVRKVKVYQGYPRVPVEFYPYNLFLP